MGENGPLIETAMLFEDEDEDVDKLGREEEDEDNMADFDKDDGIISGPSSSSGRVYDRTTVLIEQDPIRLDEEGEEDCMTFLPEGEGEGDEGSLAFMGDPDGMSQGYIHHTISADQIQFIINPGSTPMPRNIEGATLTLHSECPETKLREVSSLYDRALLSVTTLCALFVLNLVVPVRPVVCPWVRSACSVKANQISWDRGCVFAWGVHPHRICVSTWFHIRALDSAVLCSYQ